MERSSFFFVLFFLLMRKILYRNILVQSNQQVAEQELLFVKWTSPQSFNFNISEEGGLKKEKTLRAAAGNLTLQKALEGPASSDTHIILLLCRDKFAAGVVFDKMCTQWNVCNANTQPPSNLHKHAALTAALGLNENLMLLWCKLCLIQNVPVKLKVTGTFTVYDHREEVRLRFEVALNVFKKL